jgi:fibronectin type 3 domain-containing protein
MAGTSYSYMVAAFDAAANKSEPSTAATATPLASDDVEAPSVPQNLTATGVVGAIDLAWEASKDNIAVAGYEVLRDGAVIATVQEPSYSDTGVMAGTSYSYMVAAFDAAANKSEPSAAATATPLASDDMEAPGVPQNLSATGVVNAVTLTWEASTDNVAVTGYEVLRDGSVQSSVQEPCYSDTGVLAVTSYS